MWPPPPRRNKWTVLLPYSFLSETPHLRELTLKVGYVARTLSCFRVEELILYNDELKYRKHANKLRKILNYILTPPYLKKRLYKIDPDLKYVGLTPPLNIPSHPKNVEDIKEVNFRRGIIIDFNGKYALVDVGLQKYVRVPIRGRAFIGKVIDIKLNNYDFGELIHRPPFYWGFRVRLLNRWADYLRAFRKRGGIIIATSRYGRDIRDVLKELRSALSKDIHIIFGSHEKGLYEIYRKHGLKLEDEVDYIINVIPLQGVRVVRSEEALHSTLSIFNIIASD